MIDSARPHLDAPPSLRLRREGPRLLLLSAVLLFAGGCTNRGLTITSTPPGADVTINYDPVGVTPVRVGFTHYGTYRMELRKNGYQTLVKEEAINPSAYGYDPIALGADNLVPTRLRDELYFHYVLKRYEELPQRAALLERAALARTGHATDPKTGEEFSVEFPGAHRALPEAVAVEKKQAPAVLPTVPPVAAENPGPVGAEKPPGPSLARDLGLTPASAPDKTAVKPDEKNPAVAVPERTPKEEQLIYQQPKIEDPEKK